MPDTQQNTTVTACHDAVDVPLIRKESRFVTCQEPICVPSHASQHPSTSVLTEHRELVMYGAAVEYQVGTAGAWMIV
jgi:hypothetical protein